ncbi:MAG TPA: M28 family metallopeptidase [Vicinamibacterales bacterium]|nr:M28 family metallopeptidase [Vicinamibacterales bacterium]
MTRHVVLIVLLVARGMGAQAPADAGSAGFSASSRSAQTAAEKVLLDTVTPDNARRWLAALTEDPHVAGTPAEKKVADYVLARFKEFGLETEMVRYDVFLNHPKHVSLRITSPVQEELQLREDQPLDESTRRSLAQAPGGTSATPIMFPAFHGYGASGKAEGEIVYVNYGTPADYTRLSGMDISVEGKIALVRYGSVFRGLKVKEAQDRGALGVLIYSDPADDGYMKGDVYPDGPMRPANAIQRGSVLFLSHVPGDPSTPGWPSTAGAKRLTRDQMTNVPKIPSLPIAYPEAEKILRRLGGPRVPDAWQGGLPFAYHVGPGAVRVAMDVQMDEGLKPIFNVIARIRGSVEPEKLVIAGNHRDAWNHGAVDPNSGTAAQIELARGLAAAMKTGWRPRRTILLASWDAEEFGLVGSTEWAEEHAADLQKNAVAYLNCDSAATGPNLGMSGTPSLLALAMGAARDVPDPKTGESVGAGWESRQRSTWAQQTPVDLDARQDATFFPRLSPLGSGSDYTVFIDHLGIPSVDFSFSGSYGVYHSAYDTFEWMDKYGDPGFLYHAAAAKLWGVMAMRLAGADVVPLRFATYARDLQVDFDNLRRDAIRRARTPAAPGAKPPITPDFADVLTALQELAAAGESADRAAASALSSGDAAAMRRANDVLLQVERAFLDPQGLPNRPWFRHLLIAPGLTTGYAAWPFPALQEAVENRDPALWASEVKRVVARLRAGAASARAGAARQ